MTPTIPGHADDISAALEALGVAEVAAVGWSAQVPGAELRDVAGIGHLVALTRWADVVEAVA